MESSDQTKGKIRSGAKRFRIYNLTVCTLVEGVPARVNVRVRVASVQEARTRLGEIMGQSTHPRTTTDGYNCMRDNDSAPVAYSRRGLRVESRRMHSDRSSHGWPRWPTGEVG